jgi:hypothetical protein
VASGAGWGDNNAIAEIQVYFDNNATIDSIRNDSAGLRGYSEHMHTQFKFGRERYMRNEVASVTAYAGNL